MNRHDFSELGEEIKNLVQDAIDSQNFDQLSRTIGSTINQTLNGMGQTFNDTVNTFGKNINDTIDQVGQTFRYGRQSPHRSHTPPRHANPRYPHPQGHPSRRRQPQVINANFPPELVRDCRSLNAGGMALAAIGSSLAGMFGLSLLIVTMASHRLFLPIAILSIFFAGSLTMALLGFRMRGRYQRFQIYLHQMRGRTYGAVQDLADAVGKTRRYVVRDLKNMFRRRMFLEGHLDRQGTCLMISNDSYRQYQQLLANSKEPQRQKKAEKPQAETEDFSAKKEEYPEEVRKIIAEGNSYIEKIRTCSAQISDAQFVAKLARLELIVTKIFNRVKEKPDLASDLRKFIEYYLPTTWKLIEAYCILDQQPIQGENISSSKQEIKNTLDTINEAFENLLDRFFKDTAWDISTDISALQMMLAQEGLTDQGFPGSQKKK